MIKNKLTLFIFGLFSLLIYSVSQAAPFNSSTVKAEINKGMSEANVKQRYVYDVFYKKTSIGKMELKYDWEGKDITANSSANFSFLFFSFSGSQASNIYWDDQQELFLTRSFLRKSSGFSKVKMTANFDETGHNTKIVNNGKKSEYTKISPIIDFNTINLQISDGLKKNKTEFEFYMQTSKNIAHYYFKVNGKEVIQTKFGDVEAYRVEQIKKKDRTFIAWFAPDFEFQMVKFHYERKVLDIRGELIEHNSTK